jgi:hypothetical protein
MFNESVAVALSRSGLSSMVFARTTVVNGWVPNCQGTLAGRMDPHSGEASVNYCGGLHLVLVLVIGGLIGRSSPGDEVSVAGLLEYMILAAFSRYRTTAPTATWPRARRCSRPAHAQHITTSTALL